MEPSYNTFLFVFFAPSLLRVCVPDPLPDLHIPLMRFPLREYFCARSRWNGSVSHRGCFCSQRCRGLPLTCPPSSASLRASALTASASRSTVRYPCPRGGQRVEYLPFSPEVRSVLRGLSVGLRCPLYCPTLLFKVRSFYIVLYKYI